MSVHQVYTSISSDLIRLTQADWC